MATPISPGTSPSSCHRRRLKLQIELFSSWTRVAIQLACLLLLFASGSCYAAGSSPSYGFTIHHRSSDTVRARLPAEDLPERGTVRYYAAMAERDRIHGRRLATGSTESAPLTFIAGNTTYLSANLGFLYYANVSIGTPGLDFLVALDTGSDLFWLPCDCVSCNSVNEMPLNIYELNTSSTSKQVSCASSFCEQRSSCTKPTQCPYETDYLSANTSSSGYLVEDVLHLTTDVDPSKPVDANITFGCGQRQTGAFLEAGVSNGVFGLGMGNLSVPSVLASSKITAGSFSMCFTGSGLGRISFGDKGTSDQAETPFNLESSHPRYNVSITQVTIGSNSSDVDMSVIFDSGTSFTILSDPFYSIITEAFDSQVKDKRIKAISSNLHFEYCYEVSSCKGDINAPSINLTMKGGSKFNVLGPLLLVTSADESQCFYCLGIMKDESINIIAENFMAGYRIVFDREKMVLGWEESDCNYKLEATGQHLAPQILPRGPPSNSPISPLIPQNGPTVPATLDPTATPANPSSSGATSAAMRDWRWTPFWIGILVVISL